MSYTNQKIGIGSLQLDESEMMASCLDIFSSPLIENHLVRGKDIIVCPINAIDDDGPFEIHIKSSDRAYIFMPFTRMHGCFSVVKVNEEGREISTVEADDYSVVNLTGNSLFKQMECYVNNVQVMDQATGTYGKLSFFFF